ncbi:hypothetical protein AJ78_07033 [Emergomyces pasteurianus Ep9510]|uniref:RNA polymerase I-specific transcription initiation factor rrn11 n=1 Tax=Emergomyces pasteurianus Ep9510 TaxID=1447872 RepID=A0A1J9P8D8_9EURO|nr:hypothetical protein AJ78_07033 [Emergomyces pasteurianus Ep9510]
MSSSYFSLPLATWQQPSSFRTAQYEACKRKQNNTEPGQDIEEDEVPTTDLSDNDASATSSAGGHTTSSVPRSPIVLSPNEAHQYRVAGQPFHRELPGGSFPHSKPRPGKDKSARISRREIEKELAQYSPPIYIPKAAGQNSSLRLQHLAVITTILHRCLLEGDYTRAGRAWGLILRYEFGGHGMDVRNGGRWGIGAEILLWSDQGETAESSTSSGIEYGDNSNCNSPPRRRWFTRRGFELAKSYYERLILQFPYRKSAPRALGPLDFYPAMFGLWISLVQEESQSALAAARDIVDSIDINDFDDLVQDDSLSVSSDMPHQPRSSSNRRRDITTEARRKELVEAQQIAAQMDELLISPPFSDSYELLRLRGMLSLWIADLFISSVSPEDGDIGMDKGYLGDDLSMLSDEERGQMDSVLARMEQGLGMERKKAEVARANDFFEKAKAKFNRKQSPLPSDEEDEDDSVF